MVSECLRLAILNTASASAHVRVRNKTRDSQPPPLTTGLSLRLCHFSLTHPQGTQNSQMQLKTHGIASSRRDTSSASNQAKWVECSLINYQTHSNNNPHTIPSTKPPSTLDWLGVMKTKLFIPKLSTPESKRWGRSRNFKPGMSLTPLHRTC